MNTALLAPYLTAFFGAYGLLIVLCACQCAGALLNHLKEHTMNLLRFLTHTIQRHGVKTPLALACLGLLLTALMVGMPAPVNAATTTPPAPTSCSNYHVTPHGFTTPATITCVAHSGAVKPNGPVYCEGDHLVIYQDAGYRGDDLCFGPGDYNLTNDDFCFVWPFCGTANDQLSSFANNTPHWGYMTTDINGGGNVLWFSAYQAVPYVGSAFNDQISYIHLS